MSVGGIVLVGLAIAVGLVGVIVPLLPGTLLVFAAIAVWAVIEHTLVAWVVLGVVTAVLGIVGFFVVPVIGLLLGFILGVYLAELAARRDQRRAWAATVLALKAAALSVGVELAGGLIATLVWLAGVLLTQ